MSQADGDPAGERRRRISEGFSRTASGYGEIALYHALGSRLVALADIRRGARVLDVACGRGAVLFPAALAAGPEGQVVGVDLAAGMAQAAAAECVQRGLSNASVRVMDAEELAFPDGFFDRVLCAFSIFFFPHPYRALAEFRRVLAPGGRLAISTWGEADKRWDWLGSLIIRYLPTDSRPAGDDSDGPRPDFRKPEGLQAFLRRGGFEDIQIVTDEEENIYDNPTQWWAHLWTHPARVFLEAIIDTGGQEALEQFKAEAFAQMAGLRQADGYPERQIAHFTAAARR
jgi:ubiquinone/menaquinone biosynthesis C-methylase UbiE